MKEIKTVRNCGLVVLALWLTICAGCANEKPDETLIEVKVISQKTSVNYKGKSTELFPHIVVERVDNGERIAIRPYSLGKTGEIFKVKACNLRW
jgi:ABC-type uncharacterized transport system auxiliary subunit